MVLPPNALTGFIQINPAAAAPGAGSTQVVAPPGVGFHLRIWTVGGAIVDPTLSIPILYLPFSDGTTTIASITLGTGQFSYQAQLPGGIVLAGNQDLRCTRRYSIANRPFDMWAHYTIEAD